VTAAIVMENISKAFAGSIALDDVSLTLEPGSVHALMGENGAGKSTLMKILAGVHQPDAGSMKYDEQEIVFANPKDALSFGISTVFQELSLLPNLTIAENMFLGREPVTKLGGIDYSRINKDTSKALAELELNLDPRTLISDLSIAERQFVEIAHGIKADAAIFVLDEPTAALNAADVEILNRHIRRLKEEGKAIVYISHRMDEIFEICDTVTVLKDGRFVGTEPLSNMTPDSLISMMVGRELEDLFPERANGEGPALLNIINFQIAETSKPFSIEVRKGEIVALAGLEGQGQQKLARALIGQFSPYKGTAVVNGQSLSFPISKDNGVRQLQALGAGFVPEDRKDEGLFLDLAISHNISMGLYSRQSEFSVAKSHRKTIADTMQSMSIKAAGLWAAVSSMSGGNQQKVLLGRYMASDVEVLIIEEPTRGVDIGAKSEIYNLLRQFTQSGGAILVLSRETVELIGLCDRIYVVHDNTIAGEMHASEATEHNILEAALSS